MYEIKDELFQGIMTNDYDYFWGDDKNTPKDDNIKSLKLSSSVFNDKPKKPDRKKFDDVLKAAYEESDSVEIKNAIRLIADLPDDRDKDFEFKKYCWNNGHFMSQSRIYEELERMKGEEFRRSGAYKDHMISGYFIRIFIPLLVYILHVLFVLYTLAYKDIFPSITAIFWITSPAWGFPATIAIIAILITKHSENQMEYASNYGANAYNDRYYRDARNSAIMAGTTAVISAISLAKTVNDKVKKESQIKQDF